MIASAADFGLHVGEHVEVRRRYPYHGEELMIRFSTETLDYVKSTQEIEEEVGAS